jgi:predicted dehydrogenase
VLADPDVQAVLIGTRHDSHASLVCDALGAGKGVFVEKPLCLTETELDLIEAAYRRARTPVVCVGFNRRHSPHVQRIAAFFESRRGPLALQYRVNAERLPDGHWLHGQGGYLLGEVCHFIDTVSALSAPVRRVAAAQTRPHGQMVVTLELGDGSIGSILYTTAGAAELPKERLEVYGDGRVAVLDDFARTDFYANGRSTRFRTRPRAKGFAEEIRHFVGLVARDGGSDALFDQARNSTIATLRAARALEERQALDVT